MALSQGLGYLWTNLSFNRTTHNPPQPFRDVFVAEFIPKNDQDVAQSLIAVVIEGPPSIAEDVK